MPRTLTKKVVLLGAAGVGKTAIVTQFTTGKFKDYSESTIGASFFNSIIPVPEEEVVCKFQLWDTAGQERFASLAPMYYRGADIAIVVYDITTRNSWEKAKYWITELDTRQTLVALVGNKADMAENRTVSNDEASKFAQENNLLYFETSAKTAMNIKTVFYELAKRLLQVETQKTYTPASSTTVSLNNNSTSSGGCCS